MDAAAVGRTVKWARRRAAMTQHDLARAAGMPQPSIARIESGTVVPRTATLVALLEATGHQLAAEPMPPPVPPEAIRRRLAMSVPARTRAALGRAAFKDPQTNPIRILRRLRRFAVAFVLIGDLAEAVHGSPIKVGRTIEICHARTDVARDRLDRTLEDLEATSANGVDVTTRAGRLRLATEVPTGDDYGLLARNAVKMHVDAGILVPVASLDDLVRIRMARNTLEDRQEAAVLGAIRG